MDLREAKLEASFHDYRSPNFRVSSYGMSAKEIQNMTIDLGLFDKEYSKWAEDDDDVADLLNARLTK